MVKKYTLFIEQNAKFPRSALLLGYKINVKATRGKNIGDKHNCTYIDVDIFNFVLL
jgi:hypothetical protein